MLITIDGCCGVGKTTLTDYLIDQHGFAELPFGRQFERHLAAIKMKRDTICENGAVRAAIAFGAYNQAADVPRPFFSKFVCDHFWETAFFQLYMNDVIHDDHQLIPTIDTFNQYMRGYDLGRPVISFWLDTPYIESCRRAILRDQELRKQQIDNLDCWRNFAFALADQLEYFKIIDATPTTESVQKSVTQMLETIL